MDTGTEPIALETARFEAACAASSAGCGRGLVAGALSPAERACWVVR